MKISIVHGFKLEILMDETTLYNDTIAQDQLGTILNKYMPPVAKIQQIYLYVGPGSLVGARSLIAYILGFTAHYAIEIFYIDIIRDWYLKRWPHHHIIFPFTNKKLLVGYEADGKYNHYFIENLHQLPPLYWIDHRIKHFNFDHDDHKVIHWSAQDLFTCSHQRLEDMVEYKVW
jgi:hypothetical protein